VKICCFINVGVSGSFIDDSLLGMELSKSLWYKSWVFGKQLVTERL